MIRWLRQLMGLDRSAARNPPSAPVDDVTVAAWRGILDRKLPIFRRLPTEYRGEMESLMARFIAEKQFWGAEGLAVTDDMKVLVAAQACLLILNLPRLGLYPRTREVILYPREFGSRVSTVAPDGRRMTVTDLKIGETWHRGPVLLAWDTVAASGWIDGDGHNVVLHEFAHALDMLDGAANGTPPLETKEQQEVWQRVMTREYNAHVFAVRHARRRFLDAYGATDPAEFFAVATEQFFESGYRFRRIHPELYAQLKRFYGLDPSVWNAQKNRTGR